MLAFALMASLATAPAAVETTEPVVTISRGGRIGFELLGGALTGAAGGVVGGLGMCVLARAIYGVLDDGCGGQFITGFPLGVGLGSGFGAYLAGRLAGGSGRLAWAVSASIVSGILGAAGYVVAAIVFSPAALAVWIVGSLLPIAAGVLGYELSDIGSPSATVLPRRDGASLALSLHF